MTQPLLGGYKGHECENCGKRYSDSKSKCPFCGYQNVDYVPRSERFATHNTKQLHRDEPDEELEFHIRE